MASSCEKKYYISYSLLYGWIIGNSSLGLFYVSDIIIEYELITEKYLINVINDCSTVNKTKYSSN